MIKNIVVIIQLSWHMNCFYCYCSAYTLSPSVALSTPLSRFPIIIIFIFHLSCERERERWEKWQQKKVQNVYFFMSLKKYKKFCENNWAHTHKKNVVVVHKKISANVLFLFLHRTPSWMSILCQICRTCLSEWIKGW